MNFGSYDDGDGGRITQRHILSSLLWLSLDCWWSYLFADCFVSEYIAPSSPWNPDYISIVMLTISTIRLVFTLERAVISYNIIRLVNTVVTNYSASTQPFSLLKKASKWCTILFFVLCILLIPAFLPFTTKNCHRLECMCFFGRVYTFYAICLLVNACLVFMVWLHAVVVTLTQPHIMRAPPDVELVEGEIGAFLAGRRMPRNAPVPVNADGFVQLQLCEETCPICLEDGPDSSGDCTFALLHCGHKLHLSCLRSLVHGGMTDSCPVCRQPMAGGEVLDHHHHDHGQSLLDPDPEVGAGTGVDGAVDEGGGGALNSLGVDVGAADKDVSGVVAPDAGFTTGPQENGVTDSSMANIDCDINIDVDVDVEAGGSERGDAGVSGSYTPL